MLRKVTVYALGRRLFTIPRLVIPLRDIQKNPNIIPRVGQTQEEGFFLKTQYAYTGTKALAGFLLLDLMSKKGFGKGIDQSYRFPTVSGNVQLYQIFDKNIQQNTFTGRASHSQQLGTLRANFATDFRSNSYLYAPQSQSINSQLTLTRERPGANTSLVVQPEHQRRIPAQHPPRRQLQAPPAVRFRQLARHRLRLHRLQHQRDKGQAHLAGQFHAAGRTSSTGASPPRNSPI